MNDGGINQLLATDGDGVLSWTSVAGAGGLDASGSSANYISKFIDADTLTNSVIYETGGKIGIGTTAPSQLFQVNNSGANAFVVTSGGNVGIGATSPGQKLSVNGTFGIIETGASPQYYTIFQGGDQGGDITYTLPVDDGGPSQVLTSNGTGTLTWESVTGVGGIDGTGQANYAAYWLDADTLTNEQYLSVSRGGSGTGTFTANNLLKGNGTSAFSSSIIYDSGTNVGIGTTDPQAKLDVAGDLRVQTLAGGATNTVVTHASGVLQTQTIDSRVWGSSLADGTGQAGYAAYWSDANTLTNEQYLSVTRGGTGTGTFATGGVLYGNATGAIQTTLQGTSGQVLVASDAQLPVFRTLSGDVTINYLGETTITSDAVALRTTPPETMSAPSPTARA